ncbi:hypothetical protein ATI61_11624 [Archangium gephyra]|uniref:Uncharacterized protein n=2 Tax=Archangium gephyra TaxID=48 RepID=A0ABX9JP51_9BACT|nr:hypothetical protein ATI61_11624 [Archangium gephyra]
MFTNQSLGAPEATLMDGRTFQNGKSGGSFDVGTLMSTLFLPFTFEVGRVADMSDAISFELHVYQNQA